ncbi:putative oxidoreductase [Lachnellula hyalina]|uniref:Putative oxidoreductase n=1 Tax=Lachnellula hyalina TaxID=1316788 RepID=A0A8H8TYM7_9HELO|nr:putative oxidoreductase [Lachnellula hyalina]TVY27324.1 putative oxidoreductase [Lachnellula hyalina]
MSFAYKHVLLVGATAGIGKGMADRLVKEGVKVTAVGRRQDRLDRFVKEHGESKASGIALDIGNLAVIPKFAEDVMIKSPDIDCLFLNAGVQSAADFSKPETVDLAKFNSEMNINFLSYVALVHAFIPFLKSKGTETGIIFTGSHLAIVPAATLPAYSASKAALNAFTLCLRDNLRNTSIKVIELSPPVVQTELHDYVGDRGRTMGMPLEEFTQIAYDGLVSGSDQIIVDNPNMSMETFNGIVDNRRGAFAALCKLIRGP